MIVYTRRYNTGFSIVEQSFAEAKHVLSILDNVVTLHGASYTANEFANDVFIFDRYGTDEGENYGFSANIVSNTSDTITLSQDVPNQMTYNTSQGEDFVIMRFTEESFSNRVRLGRATDLTFSTRLDGGFADCYVVVPVPGGTSGYYFSTLVGSMLEILDDDGMVAWEGQVSDISIKNDGLEIEALGFYDSLNQYIYQIRETYDTSDGGSYDNAIDLIKNVLSGSKTIRRDQYRIDLDDVIATNTTKDLGEFKFDLDPTVAIDAIETILSLGDGSNQQNSLHLQVWENRLATLLVGKRTIDESDAKWSVDRTNIAVSEGSVVAGQSSMGLHNRVIMSYNDANGEQQYMMANSDWRSILRYGERETVSSDGNIFHGEADEIARIRVKDKKMEWKSELRIVGGVRRKNGGSRVPVHYLRAGDIVYCAALSGIEGVPQSAANGNILFMIHGTKYDYRTQELTVEPGRLPSRADVFLANAMDVHT